MQVKREENHVAISIDDKNFTLDINTAKRLAELISTKLIYKPEVANYFINNSVFNNKIIENEDIMYVVADECREYKNCNEDTPLIECIDNIVEELGDLLDPYKIRI
mgnify:CR=1 FL=1